MSDPVLNDEDFMREALKLAASAGEAGEVPIGAVAVENGRIIGRGFNTVESGKSVLLHAELKAMEEASRTKEDWRLEDVTVYVTKEPCAMCAGAMVNARVKRVVYGMADPRSGCAGSALDVTAFPGMLHRVEVTGHVLEEECVSLIRDFFRKIRRKEKCV